MPCSIKVCDLNNAHFDSARLNLRINLLDSCISKEVTNLLGYDVLSRCNYLPTSWRILLFPHSGFKWFMSGAFNLETEAQTSPKSP